MRGLSGPAVLQGSSYWREGQPISVDLAPGGLLDHLRQQRQTAGRHALLTELARHLPVRLVDHLAPELDLSSDLADQSDTALYRLCDWLSGFKLTPSGTEGYRTAEVTLGGIDTDCLSSQTLEARAVPELYAIGEAVDVAGWLGDYDFQWARSTAMAAARAIATA